MPSTNTEEISNVDESYSISGRQLKLNSAADIKPYLDEIKEKCNLLKINFSGNTLGVEASKKLAESLLKHKDTLREVNFSDLYTGRLNTEIPQSLEYLLPALLKCSALEVLDLSDNAIGLQAIDPLEKYLSQAVTLEHLILSNNGMGPFAGARIGKSLFVLRQNKKKASKCSLKSFICGRNRLENGSIDNLSIGLKHHEDLEVLRLYQNGIRPVGISKLIKFGISENKKLKVVDLQDNTLTIRASLALAAALDMWPGLIELNINDCLMKPKGSKAVCRAFAEGSSKKELISLRLQYNELEEDSLEDLVNAMENKFPHLKELELNGNRFEEECPVLRRLVNIFEKRGVGALDDLDDLEEIDSEEEEEEEEEEGELEEEGEEEQKANISSLEKEWHGKEQDEDKNVSELTGELEHTHI